MIKIAYRVLEVAIKIIGVDFIKKGRSDKEINISQWPSVSLDGVKNNL